MSSKNDTDGYFFARAISSLRTAGSADGDGWSAIREYWEALAEGSVDEREAARWAQEIAKRVVRDVLSVEDAQARQRGALSAIGFVGTKGVHQEEREYLQMVAEFDDLVDEDKRAQRPTRRQLTQQMLKSGYFKDLVQENLPRKALETKAMNTVQNIQRTLPRKK